MLLFGVFSLAVSPGTWPGGAWVPGGPCPGFSLLLFSHDPEVAFSIMHQDVSHVSLAQRASPQFENRVQIFTSHLSMMNLQDQVTLTNWPASKKKLQDNCKTALKGKSSLRSFKRQIFSRSFEKANLLDGALKGSCGTTAEQQNCNFFFNF